MKKQIPTQILQTITPQQAWHYNILPYETRGDYLYCFTDAENISADVEEELEIVLGHKIKLEAKEKEWLRKALAKHYRKGKNGTTITAFRPDQSHEVDFVNQLIYNAGKIGSSDIHIEPYEQRSRIRFRIDGVLVERYSLEKKDYPAIVNKIKVKANLDIAEKRLPQDGRIFFKTQMGNQVDIRVSVVPTLHGEKIVMRLLNNNATDIDLENLGFSIKDKNRYLEGVRKTHGMVLISGPTGSGKTTTLYATLKILNTPNRNIQTIEDPVEYTLEGINQSALRENIGYGFASAMRTFLRQDPDVIMVGEIRDKDTAEMAIRASLTGHLVLSTIHTNSAWGIVPRLVDMGIPAYLLADTLNAAVAQRLVRRLCPSCKQSERFDPTQLPTGFKPIQLPNSQMTPTGCDQCHYTGYSGRKAIYEVIPIDNQLKEMIKNLDFNVREILKEKQIKTLKENAFKLFKNGETSIEEIYPILSST
ncbi:MAG: GspE/PulE family protein [Bacteroidota bacterium]